MIAKKYNRRVHVLHITTSEEMDFLRKHKDTASVELLANHLTLHAPECYEKLGTLAQQNPPIREKHHQDALWKALNDGTVDILASDHAPHTLDEKAEIYPKSPSGTPGVQTLVPVMLNHVNDGKLSLNQLMSLVCENPVKIFGIKNKGFIKEGFDADFTIVDMNKKIIIKNQNIESKCGWSPFDGFEFKGTPVSTIIGGKIKMQNGKILGDPEGKPLIFES